MLESRIGYAARNRISAHVNHHYYVPSIPSLGGEIDDQKDDQIDIFQASDFWSMGLDYGEGLDYDSGYGAVQWSENGLKMILPKVWTQEYVDLAVFLAVDFAA